MKKCNSVVAPDIPPKKPNVDKLLLSNILTVIKELDSETKAALLEQNEDIDILYNNLKTELKNEIAELLDSMQQSGELDTLIIDSIAEGYNALQYEINNNVLFYGEEVYTEKLHDTVSNTDYYLTHIPPFSRAGDPLRLRVGIANDNELFGEAESTLHFAQRKNATVAINAGFFDMSTDKPDGSVIMDGQIIINQLPDNARYNYICIDKFGNLKSYPFNYSVNRMIAEGVVQAVCGTVILIENNESNTDLPDMDRHPRQCIGQKTNGEIIILTCDGRDIDNNGMTYGDLQRIYHDLGVINAYNLDGGGSTSTVLREIKQNDNIDQYNSIDRKVVNFFYLQKITTPSENQIINDAFEEIGKVKNELIERIVNSNIVEKGWIRLLCKEGFVQPGIEAYIDGDNVTRYGKMGWNGEQGYWYANLINENGELENVVRADHNSLWNWQGQLADLMAYPRTCPDNDCNVTGRGTTMFYCIENNVSNNPGIGNCLILHLPFTSNLNVNIRQIAIPLSYNQPFKIRGCSASGVWNEWKAFTGNMTIEEE